MSEGTGLLFGHERGVLAQALWSSRQKPRYRVWCDFSEQRGGKHCLGKVYEIPGQGRALVLPERWIAGSELGRSAPADEVPLVPWASEREDRLLKPSEAAAVFGVDPKTMTRWAKAGKIRSVRTIGGHRRYDAAELRALADSGD